MMTLGEDDMGIHCTILLTFLYVWMFLKLKVEKNTFLRKTSQAHELLPGLQPCCLEHPWKPVSWGLMLGPQDLHKQTGQEGALQGAWSCQGVACKPGPHFASWNLCSTLPWSTVLPGICPWRSPEREFAGWQRSPDYDVCTLPRQLHVILSSLTRAEMKATPHSQLRIVRAWILIWFRLYSLLSHPWPPFPTSPTPFEEGCGHSNLSGLFFMFALCEWQRQSIWRGKSIIIMAKMKPQGYL